MRKKLPIGIDSFEKLRTNDFYYVDKTGFIADLLRDWGEVNLFTPRQDLLQTFCGTGVK